MRKYNKILFVGIVLLALGAVVAYLVADGFFDGHSQTRVQNRESVGPPSSHYGGGVEVVKEEEIVKKIEPVAKEVVVGTFSSKSNVSNALDTLVIVDTDFYDITEADVLDVFEAAEDLWLKPLTGVRFNVMKVVFVSFDKECPQSAGLCNKTKWLGEDFPYYDEALPEYISMFTREGVSGVAGGYSLSYHYSWMNQEDQFCNEFPFSSNNDKVPIGVTDYQHKYGACGYDKSNQTIISDVSINGQCKNQAGLDCITQNGYQICPNLADKFFAKDSLYFTSNVLIHELLHPYGDNGNFDHFGTAVCKEGMGAKMQELESAGVSAPFDDLFQQYAGMCPNVWENFKNSQKSCDN